MRLSFRAKLMTIVGAAALAFILLTTIDMLIADRVEQQLAAIQKRHLPKMELGPKLESGFERLRRALQDAVAAQDGEALVATRALKSGLLQDVAGASAALSVADAAAVRRAIDDYFATAYEVSRRLISNETGEELVDAMAAMQRKQTGAADLIRKATAIDRNELGRAFRAATRAEATAMRVRLAVSAGCLTLVLLLSLGLSRGVLRSLAELTSGFERFGKGDFAEPIRSMSRDEVGALALRANEMAQSLKRLGDERDRADWLKAGHAGLVHELRGELEPTELAARAVRFLAGYLDAPAAALYYVSRDGVLRLLGQYATSLAGAAGDATPGFRRGEGLVGQAAEQEAMIVVTDLPDDYLRVRSGLGEARPRTVVLLPLVHVGRVTGVLELACLRDPSERFRELLLSVRETLAIAIEVTRARAELRDLLAETQAQAQRLAAQEDELRATNEELQAQQGELRDTNDELTLQTQELEAQQRTLEEKNLELDDARQKLELKAAELTTVSAYKSQFLANMSHELRTPLNSLLLLSTLLADNEAGNLTEKQVEFCKTIHGAGKDLLALINQVLDLAKVESGKQEINVESVPLDRLVEHAQQIFGPLARDKGLDFLAEVSAGTPATILTDPHRVEQILNNLLGNAIKFTERGQVALRISAPQPDATFARETLRADRAIVLSVSDTGIGISAEDQERIFVPFEQVDARPDRRYGGTGLGLSIARELASLLGGELQLRSTPGHGSTFTCCLPHDGPPVANVTGAAPRSSRPRATVSMTGGNDVSQPVRTSTEQRPVRAALSSERPLLVIEDDAVFADLVREIVEKQGLKCLLARDGATGLRLAKEHMPGGIILDVRLSDIDGWTVMKALRSDAATAAIPVHFVSAVEAAERGLALGAVGYLTKPATQAQLAAVVESLARKFGENVCKILIVEDDVDEAVSLAKRLKDLGIEAQCASSGGAALEALAQEHFSCLVLDLGLPDIDGLELLQTLHDQRGSETPPVVVYTGRALTKTETQRVEAYTEAVVLKDGPAAERLIDELRLFAHRLRDGLPSKRQRSPQLQLSHLRFPGRKVLVVDDDMRTVYALSALLRAKGVEVLVADTGRAALDLLALRPDVELVLMDIMMPEMDGYEATKRIRLEPRFAALPIIALTAKAMISDRDQCLEAGATDYMPKPIDADRLLVMLHSYLSEDQPGAVEQPS